MMKSLTLTVLMLAVHQVSPAEAAEVITASIQVCRKPLIIGARAWAKTVQPGPDAWAQLEERQREEKEYCFAAAGVEITSEPKDVGEGCQMFSGMVSNQKVYVVKGPRRGWGYCP